MQIRVRRRSTPGQTMFAGVLVALFGGGFMVAGLYFAYQAYGYVTTSAKATGTVVRFATTTKNNKTMYYAVVGYSTQAGRAEEITDNVGTNNPRFQVGDHIGVWYPVEHPDLGRLDDPLSLWLLPVLATGLGGLAAVAGVGVFVGGLSASMQPQPDQLP